MIGNSVNHLLPHLQSAIFFGPAVGEGAAAHFDVCTFIYTDHFATGTLYSGAGCLHLIIAGDAIFITAQDRALTNLFIFPEFAFTRRAFDGKHTVYYTYSNADRQICWEFTFLVQPKYSVYSIFS